jgi:predicted RNA methylase
MKLFFDGHANVTAFCMHQVALEQYPTSPHLTAAVILAALERDDVGPGRTVVDLGCGTGMLSIAWCVNVLCSHTSVCGVRRFGV